MTKLNSLSTLSLLVSLPSLLFLSSCLDFLSQSSSFSNSSNQNSTPSITSFAFNLQRTATVFSPVNAGNFKKFIQVDFPTGSKAVGPMPLYLNHLHQEGKKLLIFGTNDQKLIFFDLVENKLSHFFKFPKGVLFSTPTIDEEKKRLYALTQESVPLAHPHPLNKMIKSDFHYYLYSLDLKGHLIDYQKIEIGRFLQESVPWKIPEHSSAQMLCRTALTLQTIDGHDVLRFGCSILSNMGNNFKYGLKRGIRGILISIPVDSQGKILLQEKKLFFPSAISLLSSTTGKTSNTGNTGFDTGIYHAGSGFAVLPDQSFLVATGNGPFLPKQKNYGCSVIRLDPSTLQPAGKVGASPEFLSVDDKGYTECHTTNNDLTSSSVAILQSGKNLYGSIVGKDGRLRIFNPYDLPGDDPEKKEEVKISDLAIYGGPAFFAGLDQRPTIVTTFNHFAYTQENLPKEIVSEVSEGQGHQDRPLCIGLIARDKIVGGQPLSFYYSGKIRSDFVISVSDQAFGKLGKLGKMTHQNYFQSFVKGEWEPYRELQRIGYSFPTNFGSPLTGYSLQKLETFVMVNNFKDWTLPIEFLSTTQQSQSRMGPILSYIKKLKNFTLEKLNTDNGSILTTHYSPENGFCGTNQDLRWKRLYLKLNFKGKRAGWGVTAWKISEKGKLVHQWSYYGDPANPAYLNHKTHSITPVVTLTHSQNPGIVMMSAGRENNNSILALLNSETGELLQEIPFTGKPHFSMMVMIDDQIFVPTIDHGLLMFKQGGNSHQQSYLQFSSK